MRDFQFIFFQFKDFPDGTFHSGILGNTAAEYDRFLHRKIFYDRCFVVTDQCITESEQDIRCTDTFLLTVDDVRFCKYSTAARQARHALCLLDQ